MDSTWGVWPIDLISQTQIGKWAYIGGEPTVRTVEIEPNNLSLDTKL